MTTSAAGLQFIARFEGFRAMIYKDSAGLDTIGYGHLIKPGEHIEEPLTKADALVLLGKDLAIAESAVNVACYRALAILSAHQFDALVSLAFNIGGLAFANSSLHYAVNEGRWNEVTHMFAAWNKAGGNVVQGLVNRRAAEAKLWETGEYNG